MAKSTIPLVSNISAPSARSSALQWFNPMYTFVEEIQIPGHISAPLIKWGWRNRVSRGGFNLLHQVC